MEILLVRNATLVVAWDGHRLLIDPMLGPARSMPPFSVLRHRPRRNPTVPLPDSIEGALADVDCALITHCRFAHYDHLDRAGWRFLAERGIPTHCHERDEGYLRKRGIATVPLQMRRPTAFFGGVITAVRAQHGAGVIGWCMGPGTGYLIELPGEPTLYVSGDTVLTDDVRRVLQDDRPDIAVLAAGSARLDVGRPILMDLEAILEFVRLAPGTVVATHLEALNHCPTTRGELRTRLEHAGLVRRVRVPEDGEVVRFSGAR